MFNNSQSTIQPMVPTCEAHHNQAQWHSWKTYPQWYF